MARPEGGRDNVEGSIWEPTLVGVNAISSPVEASSPVLRAMKNLQSESSSVQS